MIPAPILAATPILAAISALLVRIMIRVGALDHPVERSSHALPTPKGGGVGILAALLIGILAFQAGLPMLATAGLAGGSLLIAVVSYIDDVRPFSFAWKFFAQCAAAALVLGCGLELRGLDVPGLGTVSLGWLGVPLTLAWLLFVTNSVNFIDGINGLAAGCALVAGLCLALLAHGPWAGLMAVAGLSLAAGVAGFLPFNFPRARIFMGDVGSQLCGFLLGCLGILAADGGSGAGILTLPLLLSGICADVAFTLARRAWVGDRLTQAHRSHLYQVANRSGMAVRVITPIYWGMSLLGGAACLALRQATPWRTCGVVAAILGVQLAWGLFVWRRAVGAKLGRW